MCYATRCGEACRFEMLHLAILANSSLTPSEPFSETADGRTIPRQAGGILHGRSDSPDRNRLNFSYAVEQRFAFLSGFGFALDESLPTIVRHRKGDL